MKDFIDALAGKAPVPGGGGAAALTGTLAAALCSMVANLTEGKKKYEQYQEDIERILEYLKKAIPEIHSYIEKDAKVFEPVAAAYKIPKEDRGKQEIMEKALLAAAVVPLELAEKLYELIPIMEELEQKGSKMALSDVAVAAVCCRAAMEGAVMNVYINTKGLNNPMMVQSLNEKALSITKDGGRRCEEIYARIQKNLMS